MPFNNLLTVKSNSPGNDSLQLPTLKKSNERDRTLRKPHVDIMVGSFDDDLRRKPIRHSSDLDLEGEKKDNSKFLIPESIEDLSGRNRRFSGIFKKLENFDLVSLSSDDDLLKYDTNYFIHEYSSNSEDGSFKSCMSRILIDNDEFYSDLNNINKNMSEADIKYYDIDEEGIIEMQKSLRIEYYAENQHLDKNKQPLLIRSDF